MYHIRRTQLLWDQCQEVSPEMKSMPRWPRSPLTQWSFRRYGTWIHGSDPHPNEGGGNADHPRETPHPTPFQETVQKEDQYMRDNGLMEGCFQRANVRAGYIMW